MNKLGACIWSLPGESDRERIELAVNCGLLGVQLELGSVEAGFPLAQAETQQMYRSLRESTGIVYPSLGVNAFCGHAATDRDAHDVLKRAVDAAIETALALDIPLLQFPSFGASAIGDDAGLVATAEILRYACDQTAGTSLLVGSENVCEIPGLRRLVDLVNADNFRIYFDTANPLEMTGQEALPILEASLPLLAEVHLKEWRADNAPVLLGEGDVSVRAMVERLKQEVYSGWLMFENPYVKLMKARGLSAEAVVGMDVATVRSYWA